jgi:hypothetical protein
MPFDIAIDEARGVVLVSFHQEVTEEDFAALDEAGRHRRPGTEYDVMLDMTRVQHVDLATAFIAKRGEMPQLYPNRQRIYIVRDDDLALLTKLYAAYQAAQGWRAPVVVKTLKEALDKLGIAAPDFRPALLER